MATQLQQVLSAALVVLLGCAAPRDPDFAKGRPQALAGEWTVRLQGRGNAVAVGTIHLDSVVTVDPRSHYRSVAGTFRIDSLGPLLAPPVQLTAQGLLGPAGEVRVYLYYGGECGDCGNISLFGRLRGDEVKGGWSQEFVGNEPHGRLRMDRRPGPN